MSEKDTRYAVLACCFIVLVMGLAGWYENYVPVVPSPSVAQMLHACDREVELQGALVAR